MNKSTIKNIVSKLMQFDESKIVDQARSIVSNVSPYYGAAQELVKLAKASSETVDGKENNPHSRAYMFHADMLQSSDPSDHLISARVIEKLHPVLRHNILNIIKAYAPREHSKNYHLTAGFPEDS